MEAEGLEAVRSDERVVGLRYRAPEGLGEVTAKLTVAADGRDSAVRRSVGLTPVRYGAPMDVLWFRLSRKDSDPDESFGRVSTGRFLAMINRRSYWQAGYASPKGSEAELRARGLEALRSSLSEVVPFLADRRRARTARGPSGPLRRWHLPGLLCIVTQRTRCRPSGGWHKPGDPGRCGHGKPSR